MDKLLVLSASIIIAVAIIAAAIWFKPSTSGSQTGTSPTSTSTMNSTTTSTTTTTKTPALSTTTLAHLLRIDGVGLVTLLNGTKVLEVDLYPWKPVYVYNISFMVKLREPVNCTCTTISYEFSEHVECHGCIYELNITYLVNQRIARPKTFFFPPKYDIQRAYRVIITYRDMQGNTYTLSLWF